MAIHSSILVWRIPWTEEPGGATVHGVIRRGAQGASRVAPGTSGLYACDEGEPINALESW